MPEEKISTTIITYNEERDIVNCIESVKRFSDEILVVDSISKDRTVSIARSMGCRVLPQEFLGHVKQKDLAVHKAKYDMVFCIDADERATPELQKKILDLKQKGFASDGYLISRRNWYLNDWLKVGGWYPDRKIRLFDRRKGGWKGENPHDKVEMRKSARVSTINADILHYTYRNLSEHLTQIESFSTAAAKAKKSNGQTVSYLKLLTTPFFSFFKTYIIRRGFLAGTRGLVVSFMSAFSDFSKYAKLWEMQIREKENKK